MNVQRMMILLLLAGAALAVYWYMLRDTAYQKYYQTGIGYYHNGQYEDAHTEFLKAISEARESSYPQARDILAESYLMAGDIVEYQLGRPQRALELYRKFLKQAGGHPKTVEARLRMARLYTDKLKQPAEAISLYQSLYSELPGDERLADLPERIVRLYIDQHEFEQAVLEARRFLKTKQDTALAARLQFLIGDALTFSEKYGQAMEAYAAIETDYPDSAEAKLARFEVGNCLLKLGQYRQAVGAFEQALATYPNPDVVRMRINKARMLFKQETDPGELPHWAKQARQPKQGDDGPALIDPFPEDKKPKSTRTTHSQQEQVMGEEDEIAPEDLANPDDIEP